MGKDYGVVDLLGLTGSGNPLGSNFYCHRCDEIEPSEEASVTDEVGEFDPDTHHTFNKIKRYEAEYRCRVRTEVSAITFTSGSDDPMAIESIVLVQVNKDYALIRVTAHEHPEANFGEHLANAHSMVLPAFLGFGANDFLEVFESELDVQRAEYSITLGHADDSNNIGEHLVGRSQGQMHKCTVEGITDETPGAPATGWKVNEVRKPRTNNGQYRAVVTATKLVAGPA